jgi:arylformamidase
VSKIFDLSQPIQPGMTIFPGDPLPGIQPAAGVAAPWKVSELRLGSHSGTHIDSASHYIPTGKTIDQYPLERFLLPGVVLPLPGLGEDEPIQAAIILGHLEKIPKGGAVLIQTEWDRYWNDERYLRHPHLTIEATLALIEAHPGLVGIDALNVDSTVQATDHVHRLLLEKDILIVENLRGLGRLQPGRVYQFSFLPLNLPGLDGSPLRAVAWENHT